MCGVNEWSSDRYIATTTESMPWTLHIPNTQLWVTLCASNLVTVQTEMYTKCMRTLCGGAAETHTTGCV